MTGHVEFFNKSLLQSLVIKLNEKPLNLIQLLDLPVDINKWNANRP